MLAPLSFPPFRPRHFRCTNLRPRTPSPLLRIGAGEGAEEGAEGEAEEALAAAELLMGRQCYAHASAPLPDLGACVIRR